MDRTNHFQSHTWITFAESIPFKWRYSYTRSSARSSESNWFNYGTFDTWTARANKCHRMTCDERWNGRAIGVKLTGVRSFDEVQFELIIDKSDCGRFPSDCRYHPNLSFRQNGSYFRILCFYRLLHGTHSALHIELKAVKYQFIYFNEWLKNKNWRKHCLLSAHEIINDLQQQQKRKTDT